MTLNEMQSTVDNWIKTYGVRYFHQLTNLGILNEEVGEMSRYIVRIYGEQSFKNPADEKKAQARLAEEMGDVLFVLTCLANQCEVNLDDVLKKNLEKKSTRDAIRHKENQKLK